MRTIFTTEDMKNIIDSAFNGNISLVTASGGAVEYENANDEKIDIINEYDGTTESSLLARWLDVDFYAWKNRVAEPENQQPILDEWTAQINYSINKAYALVEFVGEEAVASADLDTATERGLITFIIQTNKIKNFDYYIRKVRNSFLGQPQLIENAFGDKLTAFITLGLPAYSEEPETMQFGECLVVTVGFSINYLNDAYSYADYTFELSLDGSTYYPIALTNCTWQQIATSRSVPLANRPDQTGAINTAISSAKTISFFDFKSGITQLLNRLFFGMSAYKIDSTETTRGDINVPIWMRLTDKTDNNKQYFYKDVITEMEKVIKNTDFTTASITLRGYGK